MTHPAGSSSPAFAVQRQRVDGFNSPLGRTSAEGPFLPARAGMEWTETEIESLRVAWADPEWRHSDIAESLARPVSKIVGKARALRLGRRPYRYADFRRRKWTSADDATLRRMLLAGATHFDVAAALVRTRAAVRRRAATIGMMFRSHARPIATAAPPRPAVITAEYAAELIRRGINPGTVAMIRRA